MANNIYFIGPRASGKTSVGREVARQLGREFVDTDDLVVERLGMSIADYVERNGWEAFRDVEAEVVDTLAGRTDLVVACGGGVVVRAKNRNRISNGLVVYLKVKPDILTARLMADPLEAQRPTLTGRPVSDEVRQVLSEREPLYLSCAKVVIRDRESIEEEIEQAMKEISRFP